MLFFDENDNVDLDRYSMIKGHIQTRAVENVCPILTRNTCSVFQTAPTGFFDRSGKMLAVMEKEKEGLLVCEFEYNPLTFGEEGRKLISDSLMNASGENFSEKTAKLCYEAGGTASERAGAGSCMPGIL